MIKLSNLLKEADYRAVQNVKDKKVIDYLFVQGGNPQDTEVLTFLNMVKGNYKWKSEKQANYFYSVYARSAQSEKMYVKDIPNGTEMIFYAEMEITGVPGRADFGRKSRRKAYLLYMNRNGLIRADKFNFEYDDKEGGSWVKSVDKGSLTGIKPYEESEEDKSKEKEVQSHHDVWSKIKGSNFVGSPGNKMEKTLYFLNYTSVDTRFGTMNIYTFYDEDFNVYVYKGSISLGIGAGKKYTPYKINFTIKKHDTYNGVKQTIIEKPKLK